MVKKQLMLVCFVGSSSGLFGAFPHNTEVFDSPIKLAYDMSSSKDETVEAAVVAENETSKTDEIALAESVEKERK
jgi:hypothetical protein